MNCGNCGNPLARVLGEETITTLEGETMVFRRRTDYLLCRKCLRLFSIIELRDQAEEEAPEHLTDIAEVPDLSYFSVLEKESENGGRAPLPRRVDDQLED